MRSIIAALVLTASAATLAGCSQDQAVKVSAQPSETAAPSSVTPGPAGAAQPTGVPGAEMGPDVMASRPSASPTGLNPTEATRTGPSTRPALPRGARTPNASGAVQLVNHYFAAVDYAFRTGDTVPLREASTASNQTTTDFISRAGVLHQQGDVPLGATQSLLVQSIQPLDPKPGTAPAFRLTALYSSPAVSIQTADQGIQQVPAVPSRTVTITAVYSAGTWRVDSISDPAVKVARIVTPTSLPR